MDVKQKELKKSSSGSKKNFGTTQRQKGATPPGKKKDTKTQKVVKAQKPQLGSNQLRIDKLEKRVADLQLHLKDAEKENRQLKTCHQRKTVALKHLVEAENNFPETLTKYTNQIHAMETLIQNASARRNQNAAKLKATEHQLSDLNDSLKDAEQLNKEHNLQLREDLTRKLVKIVAENEQNNKRIQELTKHIQLSEAWYTRQLASLNKGM